MVVRGELGERSRWEPIAVAHTLGQVRPLAAPTASGDQSTGFATPAESGVRKGWDGRYFEDFAVGDLYDHPLGRTVLATDNSWFTLLTQNTAPLHFDRHYAAQTAWGKPLVDSTFTLALVTGQSVTDVSLHVFANLAWEHVEMPHPVFEGDTIYSRSRVLDTRPSKSRPEVGIVRVRTEGYNQDGVIVIRFERTVMVYRRGQGPVHARPTVKEPA